MKIIIDEGGTLISPYKDDATEKAGIGLYPDRAFFKGDFLIKELTDKAFEKLSDDIGIRKELLSDYFNIMGLSIEADSEAEAIGTLNQKLDVLELANRCEDSEARAELLKLISTDFDSLLFEIGFGKKDFKIDDLEHIAGKSGNDKYSYSKYFCVVQADGDNMGKVIKNLQNDKLKELSETLIKFGKVASAAVTDFGGLPIYAGGDDLLFIAPVVSKTGNIFDLIDKIDKNYKTVADKAKGLQNDTDAVFTSMSYGVSINYYKHPLYEVLADARCQLFDYREGAKATRNTIVCNLRKHSGSSFKLVLNKTNGELKKAFEALIPLAKDDNLVSATAHKLRENSVLWMATEGDNQRLSAFFKAYLGLGEKNDNQKDYLEKVKEILGLLLAKKDDKITQNIYSILRTAKFINGEEVKE
jgi:CRISPR-associated protein Cmr2